MDSIKAMEESNPTSNVTVADSPEKKSSQKEELSVTELLKQLEARGHKVQLVDDQANS